MTEVSRPPLRRYFGQNPPDPLSAPEITDISAADERERRPGAASVLAAHRYFGQNPPRSTLGPHMTDISMLP